VASTWSDPCVEDGLLHFRCPDEASNDVVDALPPVSLGPEWGQGAFWFPGGCSSRHLDAGSRQGFLKAVTGGFGTKCAVCGYESANPADTDFRKGFIKSLISFGPNVLEGVVDEAVVSHYLVYFVSKKFEKFFAGAYLARVDALNIGYEGVIVDNDFSQCECPSNTYQAEVAFQLPEDADGARFMVVAVSSEGNEMPLGPVTGVVKDMILTVTTTTSTRSFTSTTVTSSATSTSTCYTECLFKCVEVDGGDYCGDVCGEVCGPTNLPAADWSTEVDADWSTEVEIDPLSKLIELQTSTGQPDLFQEVPLLPASAINILLLVAIAGGSCCVCLCFFYLLALCCCRRKKVVPPSTASKVELRIAQEGRLNLQALNSDWRPGVKRSSDSRIPGMPPNEPPEFVSHVSPPVHSPPPAIRDPSLTSL